MIERERGKQNPAEGMGRLARLLDETGGKRIRFQHLYAEGVIGIDDLRARLSELDAIHSQAARRMDELEAHRKRLKTLEHDKEEVLRPARPSPASASKSSRPKIGTVSAGALTSQSESRAAASPSSRPTSTWRLVKTQCPADDPRLYPWHSPRGLGYREILVKAWWQPRLRRLSTRVRSEGSRKLRGGRSVNRRAHRKEQS